MKKHLYLPLLVLGTTLSLCGCASSDDGRPIPGTVESTSSKNSENNTPRTNPTPNPEPGSDVPEGRTVIIER
jgi:hypothetical protein